MNKIAITTGDLNGIGSEITYKALDILKPDKKSVIIIGQDLNLGYETIEIDQSDNGRFCFESLRLASSLARKNLIQGLVTSPVSKEVLCKSGFNYSGQTEILEEFLSEKNSKAEMVFIARDLRVMLLTRHVRLSDVKITKDLLEEKTKRFNKFLIEKCSIKNPKIAVLALNPHCGENGILGYEEIDIINPAIKELSGNGISVSGPYSADGLFGKIGKNFLNNKKQEFDGIIAMYHDQALCPIKALCFDEAVNTTIGLKIIRTSPSSGTAYDIKGKNIANPKGMVSAIELLLKLI